VCLLALPVAWVEVVARRQVAVRAHLGRAADHEGISPQHSRSVVQLHHTATGAIGVADLIFHPSLHPAVNGGLVQGLAAVHQVLAVRVVLGVVLKLTLLHQVGRRDGEVLIPFKLTHVGSFTRWHKRSTSLAVRLDDVVTDLRCVRVRAHTAVVHVRLSIRAVGSWGFTVAVRVGVHLGEQQRAESNNNLHDDSEWGSLA
ncbi:TPA: hypothetical protein N0F65_001101, partial [Lagenidium giganteum]